ncbi:RelA/SpoT domain-containing protein [Mycobacterium sp. smrl_JER01]|uniref:RelA/SpoT domain-containing protein n=1 Tax=Mycobacterium sp. smrl_JER01 TaxID=3402633 RepID=UPI003ACD168C
MAAVPSVSAVNKAGDHLRAVVMKEQLLTSDDIQRAVEALDVLVAWRSAHATPLAAATMGLRSRVATAKCVDVKRISQRLKRIPTIISKLHREPGMNLGRMADIGGCRAVLVDIPEVYSVLGRYRASGPTLVKVRDYIETPKPDGYRAVHVIVRYHGRLIEVQLRTRVQHEWAFTVESVTSRFGLAIKSGGGPAPVREWFQAVSAAMAQEEHGQTVDVDLLQRVYTLRQAAQPYLRGDRS